MVFSNRMDVIWVTSIICALTAFGIIWLFFRNAYSYWKKRGVPHPKPWLFFGNVGAILTTKVQFPKFCDDIYRKYNNCKYVGFYNMWQPCLVVRDPELVQRILIKDFSKFHDNWLETEEWIDPILFYNPFLLRGNKWKIARNEISGQMTNRKMKGLHPLILESCKNLVTFINENGITLDVTDLCPRYTASNIGSCVFGIEENSFKQSRSDLIKMSDKVTSCAFASAKQTISIFLPTLRKLLRVTTLGDRVPNDFKNLMQQCIKFRDENGIIRQDYLDFIRELQNNGNYSDDYLTAHIFTVFLDGHETSSMTFSFTLYELACNLEIQNILKQEIDNVLETHKGIVSFEAIQEMSYLDKVLLETLRKHEPILFMSRICTEDVKFPFPTEGEHGNEVTITKGTPVMIPVRSIHHDPKFYPEPEKFDPSRFSDESKKTRPNCCFLGFGDGPRVCLGRRFAQAQIKAGIVTIVKDYEITLNSKTPTRLKSAPNHIFNFVNCGIWLNFHRRT